MPRKTAYDINRSKKKLTDKQTKKEQYKEDIFRHLLKHKEKFFTQKQISEALTIERSAVSRALGELEDEGKKKYGSRFYWVEACKDGYAVSDSEAFFKKHRIEHALYELKEDNMWIGEPAEIINDYVVLYKINSNFAKKFKSVLKSVYPDIKVMINIKQDLYIILGDTQNIDSITNTRNALLSLSDEMVKYIKQSGT